MAEYEYLDRDKEDGAILGYDSDALFAFHGSTPIAQQALTAAVATTAVTTAGSPYGFTTAAQAAHVIELLNLIRTRLIAKGLMSA